MPTSASAPPWDEIDTVLLDMDGTLLDLNFDNYFWRELVPSRYAQQHGIAEGEARSQVSARLDRASGTLAWYCTDHWSRELNLDIKALKWSHRHLVGFLPGAREFLAALRARRKQAWIVTNAHPETIAVKASQTALDTLVDRVICSHELEAPKESAQFWNRLGRAHTFDRERTLLIEDSLTVLEAAIAYGVRHTLAIRRPDSRLPPREILGFGSIDGVAEII
jgi:HAD superfamily hydrolase (TIGR01509 family)